MALSRVNQEDLVRDDTCRGCEDGYGQKKVVAYITHASISL